MVGPYFLLPTTKDSSADSWIPDPPGSLLRKLRRELISSYSGAPLISVLPPRSILDVFLMAAVGAAALLVTLRQTCQRDRMLIHRTPIVTSLLWWVR
jgi:hypothetical protein